MPTTNAMMSPAGLDAAAAEHAAGVVARGTLTLTRIVGQSTPNLRADPTPLQFPATAPQALSHSLAGGSTRPTQAATHRDSLRFRGDYK